MIDPLDLRQVKASEFRLNGHFYLMNGDGSYSRCIIYTSDMADPLNAEIIRQKTKELADKGLLFIRINKPWAHFE